MKNLKVGKKLFLGFGITVLLMAIIFAVTTWTGLSRNSQLQYLNDITDLQTLTYGMIDEYNSARIEVRTIFTALDIDEAMTTTEKHLSSVELKLADVDAMSERLGGYGQEQLNTVSRLLYDQLRPQLSGIKTDNVNLNNTVNNIIRAGDTMTNAVHAMFTTEVDLIESYIIDGSADAVARMETIMRPAKQSNDELDAMRFAARTLTLMLDITVVPEVLELTESIENNLIKVRDLTESPQVRAAAVTAIDALIDYRDTVVVLEKEINSSRVAIETTRVTFYALLEELNDLVGNVSLDVYNALNNVVASSAFVLVLLAVLLIAAIVLSVLISILIARSITKPLDTMTRYLKQVGTTGDLNFTDAEWSAARELSTGNDEIAQSLKAFLEMLERLAQYGRLLQMVASRDLTVRVEPLGDDDVVGTALFSMVDNLSDMFGEINSSASQVAAGSQQIANGAQTLAQGATEQASAVEELSTSIAEVSSSIKDAATAARQAADLADSIKEKAERGSDQMGAMMSAVHDINIASQSINNVIKVIDEIAFQTKLLALNAAVEAAHAGQHGKGFAVVAEEVRDLAAKSAEAAKTTGVLIESSIAKAELGVRIASETNTSLREIVEGINRSSEISGEIARSANMQSVAIAQINIGVENVAQVVQQNSATAQESAAASEELSGQSAMLTELIEQFKLRDSHHYIPPARDRSAGGLPPSGGTNPRSGFGKY
ncbi:MAG: HAMP domain-containing methyl-accepting chemotaxis protein [Oscillospiraceae bacterium]|jgi:X-X-X-Leu-X-X-Gly heptad repeat protein|nr:HAMP domain-containing methyl-accepting chemotaxis protein [Oscillospiraceae bacterium]